MLAGHCNFLLSFEGYPLAITIRYQASEEPSCPYRFASLRHCPWRIRAQLPKSPAAMLCLIHPFRCLRAFSIDPSLATAYETASISEVMMKVPWERLEQGRVANISM